MPIQAATEAIADRLTAQAHRASQLKQKSHSLRWSNRLKTILRRFNPEKASP